MALIKCSDCGKEISSFAIACPSCGCPVCYSNKDNHEDRKQDFYSNPNINTIPNYYRSMNTSERKCSRCGSHNILYQSEQIGSIEGSVHTFKSKNRHGLLYWIFFGWWFWIIKAAFAICTLGLSLIFARRNKVQGNTISANKVLNHTIAICQYCGNSWKS